MSFNSKEKFLAISVQLYGRFFELRQKSHPIIVDVIKTVLRYLCRNSQVISIMEIQLAIEGEAAIEATKKLLEIPGISGSWETGSEVEKEGSLVTIATIIGIAGGTVTIAEQIRKWYEDYSRNRKSKKIEKVLVVTPKGRFTMEDSTIDEIKKALELLA